MPDAIRRHVLRLHQPRGGADADLRVGLVVGFHHPQRAAVQHAAGGVDLLDSKLHAGADRRDEGREPAGGGEDHADPHRLILRARHNGQEEGKGAERQRRTAGRGETWHGMVSPA
ncbi:MAG TPA: hypothetical protein VGN83_14015 [Falsiroseomonas sp.]|nr:hypothetical protein [Falsiroseomonas sp.]